MKSHDIQTEVEYETALHRIDVLMDGDPDPNSAQGEELERLSLNIERYEQEKFPMDLPSPVEATRFREEQQVYVGARLPSGMEPTRRA